MITIHIDPTESPASEGDQVVEQTHRNRKWLTSTIWVIVLFIAVILISLVTACSGSQAPVTFQYQVPEMLEDGLGTESLTNVGLDSKKIADMMGEIQSGSYENLYSLLIIKDEKLVFEEYFLGHHRNSIDEVASVTKSVTSILIGIAIDQGYIDGSDQYLYDLLPAYSDVFYADPLKQKLQLWHLLTMTSGIEWDEESYPYGDRRNDATAMERSSDPVQFILDRSIIREPGTQFQYSGANSMLLSAILQESTGMTLADYAKQYLLDPLGIQAYQWESYPDGHTNTDGGLSLRPRDMAKIGQLMLNQGYWYGVQVISPEWVIESTQPHTTVMPGIRYGYQWWRENQAILLESVEPYFAAGYGGQLISVYPDQNMVIVVTGETANHDENTSRYIFLRNHYLLPAAISATLSKAILWVWFLLTAGSLIFLALEIARGQLRGIDWCTYWLLICALFGPLGLATYVLSYRNSNNVNASGWKALGVALFFATGSITAIILLAISQSLFLPDGSLIMLLIPVTFLVIWLIFLSPLVASTLDERFFDAARQILLTALIASCFTLAGALPVLVLLDFRWPDIGPTNPLTWVTMTICAISAAVASYPFSYWMVRRKLDFWTIHLPNVGDLQPTDMEKRLPTLRDAWGALLLGFVVLIVIFGILISALS